MIITKKMAILEAALRSCVAVMDRDLNGLALIQPELKEAKQALEDMYLVDAEFEPWNGEGLPPVGLEVEMKYKAATAEWARPDFYSVTLAWVGKELFVTDEEKVGHLFDVIFRPIRTAEQIAAEEREAEIEALRTLLSKAPCDDYHAAVAVFEAGYRKQVQP